MLILHSCNLLLSSEAKVKGGAKGFAPIISRYASEIIASLYSEGEKANHNYWYDKWNGDWKAYAVLECIPEEIKSDLQEILCRLKSHSWVEKLEDEDWDLLATIS